LAEGGSTQTSGYFSVPQSVSASHERVAQFIHKFELHAAAQSTAVTQPWRGLHNGKDAPGQPQSIDGQVAVSQSVLPPFSYSR
jgi:hypothetical protein